MKVNAMQLQFVIYVCVGGFTTGLDLFLYWFLVDWLQVWYLLAAATVTPLTLFLNYNLHRLITFKLQKSSKMQAIRYLGLVAFNYCAALVLLYMLVDLFNVHYFVARLIIFAVIFAWNFTALRLIVFSSRT